MCRRGVFFALSLLLLFSALLIFPPDLMARGGHGSGITFPTGSLSGQPQPDSILNFSPYHHSINPRIQYDLNLLLSPWVRAKMDSASGQHVQTMVNEVLDELDYVHNNEFDLPYHDFALVYNYITRTAHPYGAWGDTTNLRFNLGYPPRQENHVDFFLAGFEAEPVPGTTDYYGLSPSQFLDWDEDSLAANSPYHGNSLNGYDGPYGLEAQNPNWYKSGGACNLRFDHEYQHMCYRSKFFLSLALAHIRQAGRTTSRFS